MQYRDRTGAAILISSHNMIEIERMCDDVIMMHEGKIIDRGSPVELLNRYRPPDLEEVFLHLFGKQR